MFVPKTKSIEFIPSEPRVRMMNIDTQEKDYKDYTEMYDLCIECINKNEIADKVDPNHKTYILNKFSYPLEVIPMISQSLLPF